MSAQQVHTEKTSSFYKTEWLIESSTDLAEITHVAPGSIAYTADGSYFAMYDGTQWVQWGGESNGGN